MILWLGPSTRAEPYGLPLGPRGAAELDEAICQAVTVLRKAGYSWAEIAVRLGVTRQAAHQRWGRA